MSHGGLLGALAPPLLTRSVGRHSNNQVQIIMKKLLLTTLIIICSYISIANAEISQEKRKEVETMLRLTGMENLATQLKGQMISAFQKQMPEISQDFWKRFEQKMDVRELIEKFIPVYDKYYTI